MDHNLKGLRNFLVIIVLFVPLLFFGIKSIIEENNKRIYNEEQITKMEHNIEMLQQYKKYLDTSEKMLNDVNYVEDILESKYNYTIDGS